MKKVANGSGNAAFFCASDTERTASKRGSQRRKRAAGLVDGIVGGERVLIHEPRELSEKGIEKMIRVALAAAGVRVHKHNIDRRTPFGSGLGVGVADLICVVPPYGRFLGIEVKKPSTRGRVSEDQQRWARSIARCGGVVGVATNVEEALALVAQARVLP